jgi:hypothetical protein
MSYTTEEVWGDTKKKIAAKLPAETREQLRQLVKDMGIGDDREKQNEVKRLYVEALNYPEVARQADPWRTGYRVLFAHYSAEHVSLGGHAFDFVPISTSTLMNQSTRGAKTWYFSTFGVAQSAEPEFPFKGPAFANFQGFKSEEVARAACASFQPGTAYHIMASVGNKSASGEIEAGQVGQLYCDVVGAPKPSENGAGDAPYFTESNDWLWKHFPATTLSDLLTQLETAPKGSMWKADITVVAGLPRVGNDGDMSGSIIGVDDTISMELVKRYGGGFRFYTTPQTAIYSNLPSGSQLLVLLSGYKKTKNLKEGQSPYSLTIQAVQVVLDVSGGTAIPEPGKMAVDTPDGEPTSDPESGPDGDSMF